MSFVQVSSIKDFYLERISEEIEIYVPEGRLMDAMIAFDQTLWPENLDELKQNPDAMLLKLAKWPSLLNEFLPPTLLKREFTTMLQLLKTTDNFWCNNRESKPHEFWLAAMNKIYLFPPNIAKLIEKLLVIPFGSADAERTVHKTCLQLRLILLLCILGFFVYVL